MLKEIFKIGPKKEDKIEIWSVFPGLTDVVPVQKSTHFIPQWFVKTPEWENKKEAAEVYKGKKGTIKRCPAIPEFMGMGITIPLWCDLRVKISADDSWEVQTPVEHFRFTDHSEEQFQKWLPTEVKPTLVLKSDCPWMIKTPPGVMMLQLPMLWHFNPIFTVCAGVIWSEFHHEINQQIMFHKTGEFLIKRGTPLAQYIPIRRETFNYDIGDQTPEQKVDNLKSWYTSRGVFQFGYHEHRKKLKKCPHE